VVCDELGNVVKLNLKGRGLVGGLPDSMQELTKVIAIDIRTNRIDATLDVFSKWEFLEELKVQENAFHGSLVPS
jgi:hypothetical protein